jgi:hypothetical protein
MENLTKVLTVTIQTSISMINQEQIQRQSQNNNFDAAATEAQQLSQKKRH